MVLVLSVYSCSASRAAEAIRPAGPIGGTDTQQALLPPPGIYGATVAVPVDLFKYSTPSGSIPASGHGLDAGVGLLWVYSLRVFGGSLASSISLGYAHSCFQFEGQANGCSKGGLSDTYVDVLMWSWFFPSRAVTEPESLIDRIPYGLAVQIGLGMVVPTGTYDVNRRPNNGANFFDFAPNIALTYDVNTLLGTAFGDATEFSMRAWLNNYTENHATHYQTGRLFNVDFSITQRMNRWQYGIWGAAFKQIEDDTRNGVSVPNGGARAHGVAIGPLVSYSFMGGARPWNITCKGIYAISGMNAAWPRGLVLRLATRF